MDWQKAKLNIQSTIRDAIQNLNETGFQIVIVVSEYEQFQGIVTDGDIRRGLLKGLTLEDPIRQILNTNALIVTSQISRDVVLHIMEVNRIQQLPIVNEERRVIGLHLWDKISHINERQNLVVLMAGGLGTRLRPHTETCPKPMLLVGNKPILEHILERIRSEGFRRIVISVRYLSHMIKDYFGNGQAFDLEIEYLTEDKPLGTAGALAYLKNHSNLPIIVSNSDVITDIKYGELLNYHIQHKAAATMAVRMHELQHPFGVVKVKDLNIVGFDEKPIYRTNVNAGIYILNPSELECINAGQHCDMPNLFEYLIEQKKRVIVYPTHESWIDIGRNDDYQVVLESMQKDFHSK